MTTTTTNYTWQMPDPGASSNTWGDTLNKTTQAIDAQVFVNQQGLVPIGTIVMFGGATAPTNWLFCQGQQIDTTVYAKLFAVIGNTFGGVGSAGNFLLPNLGARFPIGPGINDQGVGTSLGEHTGSFGTPITVANLPSHAHPITDVAHTHTIDQTPHNHPDSGHVHPDGGSTQDAHTHTVPNAPLFTAGSGVPGGSGAQLGNQTTSSAQPALHISIGAGYAQNQPVNANVALEPSGTGLSTTQAVGSSVPLNVVPPFVCLNFIIKYN